MLSRNVFPLALIVASSTLASPANAAVTIGSGGYNLVIAINAGESNDSVSEAITSLPQNTSIISTALPSSFATLYSSSELDGQTFFDWNFTHALAGSDGSNGESIGELNFSVDMESRYSISGLYELTGGERIIQFVRLVDLTTFSDLLLSYNQNDFDPDESLEVGQPSGDANNTILFGSTVGTLPAGHDFRLYYTYVIQFVDNPVEGATAVGDLHLIVTPVPEPTTLTLWGLGALGCVVAGYRRRKLAA